MVTLPTCSAAMEPPYPIVDTSFSKVLDLIMTKLCCTNIDPPLFQALLNCRFELADYESVIFFLPYMAPPSSDALLLVKLQLEMVALL